MALDANVLDAFQARNIGPAKMGGRTVALAGVNDQPNIVYAGTASGGVWKTTNSGTTGRPSSTINPASASATLRFAKPIPTSSGSAPASTTLATRLPGATASTNR